MRKLSEILKEQPTIDNGIPTPRSGQALVLFDDVLDGEKVLQSPEIEKLVTCIYGGLALSLVQIETPGVLHDWLRDEQYKAVVQDRTMVYHLNATFKDLAMDTSSDQFSGPVHIQLFSTGKAVCNILTITCRWNDGLFTNDYYVIGAIVATEDMERVVKVQLPFKR